LSDISGVMVRLPTEIEFEFAAKAGCRCINFCRSAASIQQNCRSYGENALRQPPPVSSSQENGFGLLGMHGLVWQWCSDLVDGAGHIHSTAAAAGPNLAIWEGKLPPNARIIRGGSFAYPVTFSRCATRSVSAETDRNFNLGFRVVIEEESECDLVEQKLATCLADYGHGRNTRLT
jgi:formylglycine-generating enzyme required for sulfatase activity